MIKKLLTLFVLLFVQISVLANMNDFFIVNIDYDWINKSETEKEVIIEEIKEIIFKDPVDKRIDLKTLFQDKLKDKNHIENYYAASAGYKEFKGNNISAFYYKKMKHLYMYALQDKNDLSKSFYYDALGNLQYIDFISDDYPDFPYYTIQYRINGTPVSAIYHVSKDCQYLYKPNGDFEGVWYKHKLYNQKNKVILTRTTY